MPRSLEQRIADAVPGRTSDLQRYIITDGVPAQAVLDENALTTVRSNALGYYIYATAHDNTNGFDGLLGEVDMPYGLTDVLTRDELNTIIWDTQSYDWEPDIAHTRITEAGDNRISSAGDTRIV